MADTSLKSRNLKWLWGVVVADAVLLVAIASPELHPLSSIKEFAWLQSIGIGVAPVVVGLLTSLVPSDAKAVLVFWRLHETLPGHRAFSVYAPKDSRIDLNTLRKNIGDFPSDVREQNTLWYKLYKKVASDITVAQAHQYFLLFRDLATMSILTIPPAVLLLYIIGVERGTILLAIGALMAQYIFMGIAARNNGIRFVTNVLALHSVKKYK